MSVRDFINRKFTLATFVTALALFMLSLAGNKSVNDTEKVADRLGRRIEKRVDLLDRYIGQALSTPTDQLMEIRNFPDDMVMYRYVNDSLQSWCNQFSVLNDDISSRLVFQRLTNLRGRIVSPLSEVTEDLSFLNFGPKWYIVKMAVGDWNEKVIAGIEIKNRLVDDVRKSDNGVNPKLKLDGRYSVMPLNYSGGSPVNICGKPLFKIFSETTGQAAPFFDNSILRWIALALFAISPLPCHAPHGESVFYRPCDPGRAVFDGIHMGVADGQQVRDILTYDLCRRTASLLARGPAAHKHIHNHIQFIHIPHKRQDKFNDKAQQVKTAQSCDIRITDDNRRCHNIRIHAP